MNTTPPELPPMTEKVRAAIVKKLNLCKQYGYVTLRPEEEHEILCAAMAAYDAIRESLAQSPPAPSDVPVQILSDLTATVAGSIYDKLKSSGVINATMEASRGLADVAIKSCVRHMAFARDHYGETVTFDSVRRLSFERDKAQAELNALRKETLEPAPPAAAPDVDVEELAQVIRHARIPAGIPSLNWNALNEDCINGFRKAARAAIEYCNKKRAPLRADREKVAMAIGDAIRQMGLWHTPERAERLADAAIAAMGADVQPITFNNDLAAAAVKILAERDAARAELAELRKAIGDLVKLESQHNKKES